MAHVPADVRRQQFIDAAIQVIARAGVDGATTRRIASKAGAPIATLHYCFQTKENLLWAVFENLTETARSELQQSKTSNQTVSAIASELLRNSVRWGVRQPAANRAQLEIWLWAERNDTALAARLYDTFIDVWKTALRGAEPPLPETRLDSFTRVLVAMLDGISMQTITHGDERLIERELDTATAMVAAYLQATAGS